MCGWLACALAGLVSGATGSGPEAAALVRADASAAPGPSARRLFNMGLTAEERGDGLTAVARYMAARLAPRPTFADNLYARGAGLRLLRLLAGRDDDAAAAMAAALARDGQAKPGTDLSPLVRTLLARMERDFVALDGVITSVGLDPQGGASLVVVDGAGRAHALAAPAPVGPFTAGDRVRAVARIRADGPARLVALGRGASDAWRLLAVRGLPGASRPTARRPAPAP